MKILCQNSARKTAKMTNNKGETAENYSQKRKNEKWKKKNRKSYIHNCMCLRFSETPFPSPFPSHFLTINVPFIVDWQTAPLSINKRINNQRKKKHNLRCSFSSFRFICARDFIIYEINKIYARCQIQLLRIGSILFFFKAATWTSTGGLYRFE